LFNPLNKMRERKSQQFGELEEAVGVAALDEDILTLGKRGE